MSKTTAFINGFRSAVDVREMGAAPHTPWPVGMETSPLVAELSSAAKSAAAENSRCGTVVPLRSRSLVEDSTFTALNASSSSLTSKYRLKTQLEQQSPHGRK